MKLYRAGAIQQDVLDLILLNCQVPRERLNDLRAQMASNRLGIQRFQSLCGKYGRALVLAAGDALLDYTERMTRAGIATIPPGVYEMEDRFDTDEIPDEKVFKVRIAVTGDEMSLHFESPPQVRAGLNLVWTGLLATVYYAVKTLVGPEIPANAGLFRPIHVSAPSGTMLNCTAPAAVNSRTQTCQRVVDLIHGALAAAIPDRIIAACNGACVSSTFSGVDPRTGRFYVYLETIGGGSGARATKDGLDGVHVHITNTSNLPVEALEAGVSADGRALRAGRGFGRARHVARRPGTLAPDPGRGPRVPRLRAWLAPSLGAVGTLRRPGRRAMPHRLQPGRPAAGQGAGLPGARSVGRHHHARRGRLRRSARARSRAGPARSCRGHHLAGCRARRVRPHGSAMSAADAGGPILTTARLRLRQWREEDLAPFAALNADPQVMEFFPKLADSRRERRGRRPHP